MRTVRAVCTCGLPQSSCPVASAVSGAGDSPAPSRSAGFQRFTACSNPAARNVASRRTRQAGTNPAGTCARSRVLIRSAARSIPITSVPGRQRRGSHRIRPVARRPPRRGRRGRGMPAPARPARHQLPRHPQRPQPSPAHSNGVPSHSKGPSLWLQGGRRAHPGRAVRHTGQGSYFLASDGDDGPCPPGQSRRRWLSQSRSGEGSPRTALGAWCHPFHPIFTCIGWTPHTGLIW